MQAARQAAALKQRQSIATAKPAVVSNPYASSIQKTAYARPQAVKVPSYGTKTAASTVNRRPATYGYGSRANNYLSGYNRSSLATKKAVVSPYGAYRSPYSAAKPYTTAMPYTAAKPYSAPKASPYSSSLYKPSYGSKGGVIAGVSATRSYPGVKASNYRPANSPYTRRYSGYLAPSAYKAPSRYSPAPRTYAPAPRPYY